MATHIIPEIERDIHTEDEECHCLPDFFLDEETGEMIWAHQLLEPERLLKDFINVRVLP